MLGLLCILELQWRGFNLFTSFVHITNINEEGVLCWAVWEESSEQDDLFTVGQP